MMKKFVVLFFACILILLKGSTTLAIDFVSDEPELQKFAIGVEIPDFADILSITVTYNFNERISLQGIICLLNGSVNYPGVKMLYRFFDNTSMNMYVYGSWRGSQGPFLDPYQKSVQIYAYGLGAEYKFFSDENIRYIFELGSLSVNENYSDDPGYPDYTDSWNWVDLRVGFRFYF